LNQFFLRHLESSYKHSCPLHLDDGNVGRRLILLLNKLLKCSELSIVYSSITAILLNYVYFDKNKLDVVYDLLSIVIKVGGQPETAKNIYACAPHIRLVLDKI